MPSCKSSFILLCLWQSSLFVAITWAESSGITQQVCRNFRVEHDGSREVEESGLVRVLLKNSNGLNQSCYNQGETYMGEQLIACIESAVTCQLSISHSELARTHEYDNYHFMCMQFLSSA